MGGVSLNNLWFFPPFLWCSIRFPFLSIRLWSCHLILLFRFFCTCLTFCFRRCLTFRFWFCHRLGFLLLQLFSSFFLFGLWFVRNCLNKSMFKRSMIDVMKNNCFNWFFSVPKLVYANQTGQNKQTSSSCFRRTACSTARFPFLSTSEAVSPSGTIWRCKYSGSATGFLIKGSRSGCFFVAFLGSFSSSCRIEKGILNIF